MLRDLFMIAVLLAALAPGAIHGQTRDPRTQPETAVKEAIRLLEAKQHKEFLETFARPSELEELRAKGAMSDLVKEFGERRAPDLLAALRAASAMKPTITQDGTRADYTFEKPFGRERRISMVKIGEFWYLR